MKEDHLDLPLDVSNGFPPNLLINLLPSHLRRSCPLWSALRRWTHLAHRADQPHLPLTAVRQHRVAKGTLLRCHDQWLLKRVGAQLCRSALVLLASHRRRACKGSNLRGEMLTDDLKANPAGAEIAFNFIDSSQGIQDREGA